METLVDVLNREKNLEMIVDIIEKFSEKKESVSFAIDGEWGCGKTFLLQMIEKNLIVKQDEINTREKYLILHYNCWKFDYYDEPLVAVVSLLLDEIDNSFSLFSVEQKAKIKGILKAVGLNIISAVNKVIENKTGIDFEKIHEVIISGNENAAQEIENNHNYNDYFSFNKTLCKLQYTLNKLSEGQTIVLIVDELDRCLPDYSIKVLERIHHLTENSNNIITIVATDKSKLEKSIESVGFENANQYLKKFISFEITLDNGILNDLFTTKIENYLSLFDFKFINTEELTDYLIPIFSGIDMRNRIQLIDKALLIHKMLFDERKNEAFMLLELILVVLVDFYGENYCDNTDNISINSILSNVSFRKKREKAADLIQFINKKRKEDSLKVVSYPLDYEPYLEINDNHGLFELIVCYWYLVHKNKFYISFSSSDKIAQVNKDVSDLERFVEYMRIIK